MRVYINYIIITLLLSLGACEKALMEDSPPNDPESNFEILWETFDKRYAYFTEKDVDWDAMYDKYRPMVSASTGDHELFDIMAAMLYELRDGHVNLFSSFDKSRNWTWYLNSPQNFNYSVVERNYLADDYEKTGPIDNVILDSAIGYMYLGSFSVSMSDANLSYLMGKMAGTKGLIVDIRDNGGGSLGQAEMLFKRFLDRERTVYYDRYKNGPGHDDFNDPLAVKLSPAGDEQYTKPIVLLTNRSSYSAANHFTMFMHALPHAVHIGDTSGGGGGLPVDYELPNGWTFRLSGTRTLDVDMKDIESGIAPHEVVYLNEATLADGRDDLIERAKEIILEKAE